MALMDSPTRQFLEMCIGFRVWGFYRGFKKDGESNGTSRGT